MQLNLRKVILFSTQINIQEKMYILKPTCIKIFIFTIIDYRLRFSECSSFTGKNTNYYLCF